MRWLHSHANDVVTALSCILGREREEDVFSFCPATALKIFSLTLPSCICSGEDGLYIYEETQILYFGTGWIFGN